MAVRKCPICLEQVPVGLVLPLSNNLSCPACKQPLEISSLSRQAATWLGLVAGAEAAWYSARAAVNNPLGWAIPVVAGLIAFGAVSALALILSADLVVRAESGGAVESDSAAPAQHA